MNQARAVPLGHPGEPKLDTHSLSSTDFRGTAPLTQPTLRNQRSRKPSRIHLYSFRWLHGVSRSADTMGSESLTAHMTSVLHSDFSDSSTGTRTLWFFPRVLRADFHHSVSSITSTVSVAETLPNFSVFQCHTFNHERGEPDACINHSNDDVADTGDGSNKP